jgi:2-polyprenyl-3-methyl-5-hydroxy-6-metoxy-1,4-benzoquinol methylase
MSKGNFGKFHKKARMIWETNASFWDQRMGDKGNEWHRTLIEPATLRLLNMKKGEHVLDIACGNGQLARKMTQLGGRVVAFDFSASFIKIAKSRKFGKKIDYRVIDAADRRALFSLGNHTFDAAVCTMALMDMSSIKPLLTTLPSLLKKEGRFVFSVMHPCFNAVGMSHVVEYDETEKGTISKQLSIKIREYSSPNARKGLGIIGQPLEQYYFHRPLSLLFNTCFNAGFMLDRLEEPTFAEPLDPEKAWSWSECNKIPPVLIARMRISNRESSISKE